MKQIRPIVKYHGGKGRIFQWIVPYIPHHRIYCEPFGGAASVLLNKSRAEWEIYNDLEYTIFNLMKVVRDNLPEFLSKVNQIKYEPEVYDHYKSIYLSDTFYELDSIDQAIATYVSKRMSRGGLCGTFCWSNRIYSSGPAESHCWNTSLLNIPAISERLQGVIIHNNDSLEVMKKVDHEDAFFYLDPPYVHSTRFSKNLYYHEMNEVQHQILISLVKTMKGKIAISGYQSELYEKELREWRCQKKDVANHSSHEGTKDRKTECLWINF